MLVKGPQRGRYLSSVKGLINKQLLSWIWFPCKHFIKTIRHLKDYKNGCPKRIILITLLFTTSIETFISILIKKIPRFQKATVAGDICKAACYFILSTKISCLTSTKNKVSFKYKRIFIYFYLDVSLILATIRYHF